MQELSWEAVWKAKRLFEGICKYLTWTCTVMFFLASRLCERGKCVVPNLLMC